MLAYIEVTYFFYKYSFYVFGKLKLNSELKTLLRIASPLPTCLNCSLSLSLCNFNPFAAKVSYICLSVCVCVWRLFECV